MLIGMKSYP